MLADIMYITQLVAADLRVCTLPIVWSNFRFNLGYKIGGFTSATRGNWDDE